MTHCFTLLLLLMFFRLPAQPEKINYPIADSIMQQLKGKNTKAQVTFLKQKAFQEYHANKNNALGLVRYAEAIALKNNDYAGYADVLNLKGVIFGQYGEFDSSYFCYQTALDLCKEHNIIEIQKKVLHNYGINMFMKGYYDKALTYYYETIKIAESGKDSAFLAEAMSNVGAVYIRRDDFKSALNYLMPSLSFYHTNKKYYQEGNTCNSIGLCYEKTGKPDSAIIFYNRALNISRKISNHKSQVSILSNLGSLFSANGNQEKALKCFSEALELNKNHGPFVNIISTVVNSGLCYMRMGEFKKSLPHYYKALSMTGDLMYEKTDIVGKLSVAYDSLRQYDSALFYHRLYKLYDDSLWNEEAERTSADIQEKYETEKKEKEIALSALALTSEKAENRKKTIFILGLSGAFLFATFGALFIFRNYTKKQKEKEKETQRKLEEYALEIEKLQANIDMQLAGTAARFKVKITREDINRYLIDQLTEREMEVLNHIATGKTNKQIADAIFVSENTVKFHLKNIFLKLDVSNRTEALAKAGALNLLSHK